MLTDKHAEKTGIHARNIYLGIQMRLSLGWTVVTLLSSMRK